MSDVKVLEVDLEVLRKRNAELERILDEVVRMGTESSTLDAKLMAQLVMNWRDGKSKLPA